MANNSSNRRSSLVAALVTGQLAGLIMAVAVMGVFALLFGKSPLYPVQVIGSLLLGESVLAGFDLMAVLAGLVLHQGGPTVLWSVVFGLAAQQVDVRETPKALGLGLALGVLSMLGPYVLIPFLFKLMQGVDLWNREVPMFWDWVAHLIFGASFGLYPAVLRRLGRA